MLPLVPFRRFTSAQKVPDDVVKVVIFVSDGNAVAEVAWRANALTDGGDYLYPTIVPLALERAEDVRENYNFGEVVVVIDDVTLWDGIWGRLED
jgi:hypothetical protein